MSTGFSQVSRVPKRLSTIKKIGSTTLMIYGAQSK
jgi:hypothetical protein